MVNLFDRGKFASRLEYFVDRVDLDLCRRWQLDFFQLFLSKTILFLVLDLKQLTALCC